MLLAAQKEELLKIARRSIETCLQNGQIADFKVADKALQKPAGVFVTLHQNSELRGCLGQIFASQDPLWQTVRDIAIAATTEDPRFDPLEAGDLENIKIEISVLTEPQRIADWKKIELGKHGVIVTKGRQKGVFLPQVAEETNWDLEQFLEHLCVDKAGLPADAFKTDPEVKLEVFEAIVFGEK